MRIKTSELTGAALDWAVASIECDTGWLARHMHLLHTMPYSTDWAQGGPIIERECITVSALYAQKNPPSPEYAHKEWGAYIPCGISSEAEGRGPTPLIAAMRCYVESRLGREVDVPKELIA